MYGSRNKTSKISLLFLELCGQSSTALPAVCRNVGSEIWLRMYCVTLRTRREQSP